MKYIKTYEDIMIPPPPTEIETYWRIVPIDVWEKIESDGIILPHREELYKQFKFKGNWSIPKNNILEWLIPIKYFGSPLQALLMKPAVYKTKMVLIEFETTTKNRVYNRDLSKMFINYSFKNYYGSFTNYQEYDINETFITGEIKDFRKINEFTSTWASLFIVPKKVSEYVADPKSLLDYITKNSKIIYTEKKMVSIMSALFRVLMKKIFSFDFKNF
jgi:hypothetical protein